MRQCDLLEQVGGDDPVGIDARLGKPVAQEVPRQALDVVLVRVPAEHHCVDPVVADVGDHPVDHPVLEEIVEHADDNRPRPNVCGSGVEIECAIDLTAASR